MNAPTLLVGLGGTGSEIVQRVFDRATERQRENISFVIFDTDVNELRTIEEKTPQIRTIQTSTRLTVGEYLDCDTYARDNWFPVNRILNGKALTEGAGQVRAVSRLALNTAIQQGKMAPLDEAIEDLYKLNGQRTVQAPRVILAGSLCGGTGSGLILPVAMYIRNFMSTKLQQGSTIIRGFFLLPEVFEGVIKTQSEMNNLRSNAYAAVREIDAFMMKDDGSLPAKYDLHFMAPRAGSKEQDEYTGRPMDFCFLFDAQNINGMKLNSFEEYKEHAANCIYGMAIAPTSKRSNSSEDNVIQEIVYAGGRNRFAGAGTAMLVYPTDDVKRYLALTWTKESITDEWLEVDRRFADEQKTNRTMRRKGYQVAELDRGSHYVDIINEGYAERRPFASAIRNLCYEFEPNGFVTTGISWVNYNAALTKYIADRIALQRKDLEALLKKLNSQSSAAASKTADVKTFSEWYKQLLGYKEATIQCTGALARNITYSLFRELKDYTKTDDQFRLEYWMHHNRSKEEFIHPNAARYFLYNALKTLKQREAVARKRVREIEEFWATFEENTFDDKETTDHVETEKEYYEQSYLGEDAFLRRLFHHGTIAEAQANLVGRFSTLFANTTDYWDAYVTSEVLKDGVAYIQSLCDAFHSFYDVLDRSISKIDREIVQLEKKYETKPGMALRYVCADENCLRGLARDAVNLSTSLDIPAELNCRIFQRMKLYALAEQKPEAEYYFTATFRETVIDYLENEICSQYGSLVNMDIISALEAEAHYENPETVYELEDERLYAKHAIESTENLAKPFIESPMGKEARVIPACAYNPVLADADFPGRRAFVAANLKDRGGVEDESIDPNVILFYQSVYDLRANELSKFAPPCDAETYDRPGGEYYKAYFERVRNVHPETQRSRAISPHIDRWWHVISKLPDLDEGSQARQEEEIHTAFFWGMLAQYVHLEKENASRTVYRPDRNALDLKDDGGDTRLIVSNGTPCDHLYEVLDAFTIYPKLVAVVNERIRARVDSDLYTKTPLRKSLLFELLSRFRIEEYDARTPEGEVRLRSVFDLPLLMKRSVPTEQYHEDSMIRLLDTIFRELRGYIARFCSKKEFPGAYSDLLEKQFQLFLDNVAAEKDKLNDIYCDSLFTYICKAVAAELEEYATRERAGAVLDKLRSLS